jgi:ribose-phosphate pyrophosphokinase
VPYYGYERQDRKDQPRVPITAKLVANLITVAGADRMMPWTCIRAQIQGFFDIPFDHLYAAPVMIEYFLREEADRPGGRRAGHRLGQDGAGLRQAARRRTGAGRQAAAARRRGRVMNIIGDVDGKNVVFFDDVISTGRTLCQAADAMRANGAREIYAGRHACRPRGRRGRTAPRLAHSRGRGHRHHSARPGAA